MKRNVLYLFFTLSFGCFSAQAGENQNTQEIQRVKFEDLKTEGDYRNWLIQEELVVWQSIEKVLGITKARCEELKAEWFQDYVCLVNEIIANDRTETMISKNSMNLIMQVHSDFNVDTLLQVIPFSKRNPAGSTDTVLFINEQCLPAPMPLGVKKYLLACAVAMAFGNFHSTDFVLEQLAHQKGIQNSAEYLRVKEDYKTFKQVSADIHAMLLGKEYLQGQNRYLQILMNQYGENADVTDWVRYTIGKQIAENSILK